MNDGELRHAQLRCKELEGKLAESQLLNHQLHSQLAESRSTSLEMKALHEQRGAELRRAESQISQLRDELQVVSDEYQDLLERGYMHGDSSTHRRQQSLNSRLRGSVSLSYQTAAETESRWVQTTDELLPIPHEVEEELLQLRSEIADLRARYVDNEGVGEMQHHGDDSDDYTSDSGDLRSNADEDEEGQNSTQNSLKRFAPPPAMNLRLNLVVPPVLQRSFAGDASPAMEESGVYQQSSLTSRLRADQPLNLTQAMAQAASRQQVALSTSRRLLGGNGALESARGWGGGSTPRASVTNLGSINTFMSPRLQQLADRVDRQGNLTARNLHESLDTTRLRRGSTQPTNDAFVSSVKSVPSISISSLAIPSPGVPTAPTTPTPPRPVLSEDVRVYDTEEMILVSPRATEDDDAAEQLLSSTIAPPSVDERSENEITEQERVDREEADDLPATTTTGEKTDEISLNIVPPSRESELVERVAVAAAEPVANEADPSDKQRDNDEDLTQVVTSQLGPSVSKVEVDMATVNAHVDPHVARIEEGEPPKVPSAAPPSTVSSATAVVLPVISSSNVTPEKQVQHHHEPEPADEDEVEQSVANFSAVSLRADNRIGHRTTKILQEQPAEVDAQAHENRDEPEAGIDMFALGEDPAAGSRCRVCELMEMLKDRFSNRMTCRQAYYAAGWIPEICQRWALEHELTWTIEERAAVATTLFSAPQLQKFSTYHLATEARFWRHKESRFWKSNWKDCHLVLQGVFLYVFASKKLTEPVMSVSLIRNAKITAGRNPEKLYVLKLECLGCDTCVMANESQHVSEVIIGFKEEAVMLEWKETMEQLAQTCPHMCSSKFANSVPALREICEDLLSAALKEEKKLQRAAQRQAKLRNAAAV